MSGLFGSLNKPAAGTSSLFGASSVNTQNQNPSPFGTLQTNQQTGGLFGSKPFGSSANTTLGATTLGGLMRGGDAPTGNTTLGAKTLGDLMRGGDAPTGNTTLGASVLSGQVPGGGVPASSILGGQATQGLGAFGTSNVQPQAQPAAQPTGAYFDSLLAKSKKQADGESAFGDLPSLQLGLGDLRQRLKKLGTGSTDRPLDGKAHYLLAASGVEPGAAVKDLGSLGVPSRHDKTAGWGAGELDMETYLENLETKTTLGMIKDSLERSVQDFDSFLEDNVTMEWEAQRKRIYQHFGIKPREGSARPAASTAGRDSQGGFGRSRRTTQQGTASTRSAQRSSAFGRSAMQKSVLGTPSRIGSHAPQFTDMESATDAANPDNPVSSGDDRFLREKQSKLAEQIHALNDARQQGQPFHLCQNLEDVLRRAGDKQAPQLSQAYKALMEIVGEGADQEQAPRERQYAKMYLDPNPQSENSIKMRKQILQGATRFLEREFFNKVEAMIKKYATEANLGGKPDVESKVKAYIRVLESRKALVPDNTDLQQVNGEYVWAVVFYLLRSGFVSEAAQYVNTNQKQFRSIDRTFSGYINSYASSEDRRLKRAMQERCNQEYNQRVRNAPEGSMDPFRMACYKIIGRCDISNRSLDGLQTEVQDWVWLQFNLARESDRAKELANELYGLAELQTSMHEVGLKYFPKTPAEDSNGSFGMYFYLQILAGMFEKAIAYLYPFSYVDAVHFAIALGYYGLLRPADAQSSPNELCSYNTRDQAQINFDRMLGYYTRDFRAADAGAAVDYLALMCLNSDDDEVHTALCHEALRELVLETREFSKLIGDITPDGQRIRGIMEERGSLVALGQEQQFMDAITLQAAAFAEENGRTTDAVLLYHLAGNYDNVVIIVSRALSEAVSLEMGEDPLRLLPVKPRVKGKEAEAQPATSLSLAAMDDPVELARTMMTMYERDHMFWERIRDHNRVACNVLLQMSDIKGLVEANKWPECLDRIRALQILPLDAEGDPGAIRNYAARFSGLEQPVAINVPNLLMWTIICCTKQREKLAGGPFSGNEATVRLMVDQLKQMTVDLTTYTSQLRYRFPPHLHEALARAAAD